MIRALIIALNFFIAWIISVIAGVPSATVTAPSSIQKGESFTVTVKINPNGVEEFLRYSMTLPEGWTAEKIAEDGSTYMMEKQVVKFLWSRVGVRNELNVSYKVTPPANVEGTFELPCKLSHSVNNLPSHVELAPLKIVIGNSAAQNNASYVPEKTDSTSNPSAQVNVTRVVPTEPVNGEFLVDVTIQKGDLTSFIKLQDSLPEGFSAQPIAKDGGDWSFENGVIKVQWYNPVKTNPTLHVQYKVIVSPDMTGTYTIRGHVSYVENMGNKLITIDPATIQLKENPALADNDKTTNNDKTQSDPVVTNDQTNTNKTQNDPVVTNDQTNNNKTQNDPVVTNDQTNKTQSDPVVNNTQNTNTAINQDPQTSKTSGVTFAIQIAAMQRLVPVTYYKNTFGLPVVNAEQVDGLNKYTTGSFTTYQDARNGRETVKAKGVQGPFVVAYSNGKRITVQEALMITSQKWIR